ncbi:MAG: hypothetical protein IJQ81_15325 [Oscillibacter sp.]|nr:hypothetical protein [Oscillibacter sp.]
MRRTYKDAFPNIRKGIFSYLAVPPWEDYFGYVEDDPVPAHFRIAKETLDKMMFLDYGDRLQGPILQAYDDGNGVNMSDATSIASMIHAQFGIAWRHLWKAVSAEYNPVDNYNANETETTSTTGNESQTGSVLRDSSGTITHGHSVTTTNNLSDNVTRTRNLHDVKSENQTGTENGTNNTGDKYYGFASAIGKDSRAVAVNGERSITSGTTGSTDYTGNETDAETHTGTVSEGHSGTDANVTQETSATSDSRDREETITRTLTRSGNIGVTTSAQMIKGEIELWQWSYYRRVLDDVAGYLTLSIFV